MAVWKKYSDAILTGGFSSTAMVPIDTRENLSANIVDVQTQCAHAYTGAGRGNGGYCNAATPPDQWWGIPYVLPIYPGCDQVELNLVYRTIGGNGEVKAKLRVDGVEGAEVTLDSVGASAAATLTCAVATRDSNRPTVVWLLLQSQTAVADTGTITTIGPQTANDSDGRVQFPITCSTGPTDELTPYAYRSVDDSRWYFVGAWEPGTTTSGNAYIWPRDEEGYATAKAMYELTRVEVRTVNVRWKQTGATPGSFALPRKEQFYVSKVARASHLWSLFAALWKLWYDRRQVSQIAPRDHGDGRAFGALRSRALVSALRTVRTGTTGTEVFLLAAGRGPTDAELESKHYDVSQTQIGTTSTRSLPVPAYTSSDPEDVIQHIPHHWLRAGNSWAGRDLVPVSQIDRLELLSFRVPWPSGTTVGDRYGLNVALSSAAQVSLWHVWGAGAVDALPGGRRQAPGLPWI